jgi:hypothetical protein
MNLIKILLIVCLIGLLIWAFRHRGQAGLRATARILAVVLAAIAIASVLQPDITQKAADFVGVTRGSDLVLYTLTIVFAVTSVGFYFRFKDQERRIAELIRTDAIRDAILARGIPGSGPHSQDSPQVAR